MKINSQVPRASRSRESGSAIIMTLVAAAMGVTITAALLGVMSNMNITENGARFRANGDSFNEEIRALLSSQASCFNSIGGLQVSATSTANIAALKDSGGNVVYQPGKIYMDRTLQLNQTVLDGFKRDGSLPQGTMALTEKFESVKPLNGSKDLTRSINVTVQLDGSSRITSCIALSRMTDGIWRVSQANTNNIYFPGSLPTGRVGIGTNDPISLMEVQGNGSGSSLPDFPAIRIKNTNPNLTFYNGATNNVAALQVQAGNGSVQGQLSAQYMNAPSTIGTQGNISLWAKTYGTAMIFMTAHGAGGQPTDYGEKMRINHNGTVGIGTNNPAGIVEISQSETTASNLPTLLLPNERDQPTNVGLWFKNHYGNPDARIYQGQGDNLNIIMGSGNYVKFNTNSNFAAAIDRNGTYSASDRRLKTSIAPIENVLDRLAEIPAVTYFWKDEDQKKSTPHVGIIAQDLQKEFPLLVVETENPAKKSALKTILTVDYGHLTAIVLQGLNELHEKWSGDSAQLHAKVDALEEENRLLKLRLDALEAKIH